MPARRWLPPLRLGILSTAAINDAVIQASCRTRRVELIAVASREPSRARQYARRHGIERAYGDYDTLLADPEVEAVYVSTPNSLHIESSIRALEAGKHVLCEKPFARSPRETERAFDVADRTGRVLMEAFMYRHHPQTAKLVELVRGGEIGAVRLVRGFLGFVLEDPDNIRLRPELDGGAMLDAGCYAVSAARLIAGEPDQAVGQRILGPTGVDLGFAGVLRFPGGILAQVGASYLIPFRRELEVIGSSGSIVVRDPYRPERHGRIELRREGERTTLIYAAKTDPYMLQLENLADAAAGLASPRLGRRDAVAQARVLDALLKSAAEGCAVNIELGDREPLDALEAAGGSR